MRVKLIVEYDGTDFCGWQIQPNGVTVQEKLEQAIYKVTGQKSSVTGSGRTDAGVHAEGQICHFDTDSKIPAERFAAAINTALPPSIRAISSQAVDSDFHARFCAKNKTYRYRLYLSPTLKPLLDRYAAQVSYPLSVTLMQEAAEAFVGEHDFASFMASGSVVKDTVRIIYSAEIKQIGECVEFTVCGNGFLYNMVRIMVGTLVEVGMGKMTKEDVRAAVEGKDRNLSGKTMPPRGLTLLRVEY